MSNINYAYILAAIENTRWAIAPDALRGMLSALEGGLNETHRNLYHASKEKSALVADMGAPVEGLKYSYITGSTGVMFVDGPIIPRADCFSDISGVTSIESLVSDYKALQSNNSIKNIVIMYDTPGGNITGISEFSQLIRSSKKPVISFIYGMAASAGYWMAAAGHQVVSVDTGEAGSIGVVMTYRDSSKADAARGIQTIEIVSSQSPFKRPDMNTPEGKGSVQTVLDDLASVFIESVATNRNTTAEVVAEKFGQGGMMAAKRAQEIGMIDRISTLETLLTELESSAKKAPPYSSIFGGSQMSENAKLTAEQVAAAHPEAVATIKKEAAAAENSRIASIENLSANFAGSHPAIQSAAKKVIDENKFSEGATAEAVAVKILSAVGKVQAEVVGGSGTAARELATKLETVTGAAQPTTTETTEAERKATVKGLADNM